jgi:C4-dicarboxylate transporter, DctQ subunit
MKDHWAGRLRAAFEKALEALLWISALMLVLIILSVMFEVYLRYAHNRPQAWVVEFTEYALLYITFLSAGFILWKEKNITVDIITERLGLKTRRFLSVIHYIVSALVSFVFLYVGTVATIDNFRRGVYNPTIMQVPIAYVLVVLPIGGFFLLVQSLLGLYDSYNKLRQREEQ